MTTNTPTTELRIGELADAAGVHVETVRYYQRRGLLPRPPRPGRGWRVYGLPTLSRLRFIRRAQALGFTLDEIQSLLDLQDRGGPAACLEADSAAQAKIEEITEQISDLELKREVLKGLVGQCGSGSQDCQVLAAFDRG